MHMIIKLYIFLDSWYSKGYEAREKTEARDADHELGAIFGRKLWHAIMSTCDHVLGVGWGCFYHILTYIMVICVVILTPGSPRDSLNGSLLVRGL